MDGDREHALVSGAGWFAVIDGARFPDLPARLRGCGLAYRSLFLDSTDEEVRRAGPWLVGLEGGDSRDRLASAVGDPACCVFWRCHGGEGSVFRHLRTLAVVEQPDGGRVLFRHYDPAVLVILARHLEPQQERAFFGPCAELLVASRRFAPSRPPR